MSISADSVSLSAPTVSLPKGGGAVQSLNQSVEARAFTGTMMFDVPVYASPARGLEPRLSVAYNSGSGNGAFGIGFDIAIPSVSRRTDKCIPAYDDSDTFLSSEEGQLVPRLLPMPDGKWVADTRVETVIEGGRPVTYCVDGFRARHEETFAIFATTGRCWIKAIWFLPSSIGL